MENKTNKPDEHLDGDTPVETPDTESKQNKKRKPYVDDGHTVYDMSGLDENRRADKKERITLTRGERWAVIRAAFMRFAPPMLITLLGFTAALLLIRLWLHV